MIHPDSSAHALTRRSFAARLASAIGVAGLSPSAARGMLAAFGQRSSRPRPTAAQLAWQRDELALFVHFGMNTFTDREWGDGTESPSLFNPTQLNARQWARAAKAAGAKAMVLTAKHHDGFCLWPTATTTHSVASSRWKQGQGELLTHYGPISEVWFDGANGEDPNGILLAAQLGGGAAAAAWRGDVFRRGP